MWVGKYLRTKIIFCLSGSLIEMLSVKILRVKSITIF